MIKHWCIFGQMTEALRLVVAYDTLLTECMVLGMTEADATKGIELAFLNGLYNIHKITASDVVRALELSKIVRVETFVTKDGE